MPYILSRRRAVAVLLTGLLAGCAGVTSQPSAGQPTAVAVPTSAAQPSAVAQATAAAPTAAARPTVAAQTPVPQPTVAAQPTVAPARQPTFAFDPKVGVAGTQINLNGWDFGPGGDLVVRLGLPQPIGEALISARADAAGRWATRLVLPDALPSGDPVPVGRLNLVIMDANTNAVLASAPFDFQAPSAPTRAQASQTVNDFLLAVGTPQARSYLNRALATKTDNGTSPEAAVGLMHQWAGYQVGAALDRPAEVLFVPATLVGATERHAYEFTLVVEQGQWKISGANWISSTAIELPEPPAGWPTEAEHAAITAAVFANLRPAQPNTPIIVSPVGVAADYAAAYALPYQAGKQFVYLRRAADAGWTVVLATGAPTADLLKQYGVPRALLQDVDVTKISDALMAYYNGPAYGGADGWLSVDAIDSGAYARAVLHQANDNNLIVYLARTERGWMRLIDGQVFAPETLDQLGIPASVRI